MSWFLGQASAPETRPALPIQTPTPGQRTGAAFRRQWIEDDSWNRRQAQERDVRDQILERLGDRAPRLDDLPTEDRLRAGLGGVDRLFTTRVLEAAAAAAAENPGDWGGVPLTIEDFDAEITRRQQAELAEIDRVLTVGGAGLPALIGRFAGAMTDPVSLVTLPLGAGGPLRAPLRFIASEAGLGAASEAAIIPRAQETAERLGLPEVNAAERILLGAAGGAVLAGGMTGLARAWEYTRGATRATNAARPEGVAGADHVRAVAQAEVDLRAGRPMTFTERTATEPDALDLSATTLLATTGRDGQLRAMIRLPDGTRLTGLETGAILPDGSRIAGVEAGRILVAREGQDPAPVEIGGTIGQPGTRPPAAAPTPPQPTAPVAGAEPGPSTRRFDYSPGAAADPAVNPVGYVYGRLLDLGYPPHIASGLTGNLMQESGPALNTRAVGDNGNAYGMGQWNGPRRRALYQWAEARGLDVNDIETQVLFLHHELQGPENAALRAILAAPDAQTAARVASERFWRPGEPHVENRMGFAQTIQQQFEAGDVPAGGRPAPVRRTAAVPPPDPQTGRSAWPDTVASPAGTRETVRWEVVDLDSLRPATGDLQPRDRSRAASDEQVAEIAANLDPARLMPSPEGDRGAPIVGPDDITESGNGRVLALRRAADLHPERFAEYVEAIRAAGFQIPEGVQRPALVGRRTSDQTPERRIQWVRENNTSAIARMGGAEQARMDAGYLTQPVMDALRPTAELAGAENGEFVRRLMRQMPQAERAALMTEDGQLTLDGLARIRNALFSRAWEADDLARLLIEKPSPQLRALVDMLTDLAPEWAAFRAMVQAGYIRPEFDTTAVITDMVRLIGRMRAADREKGESVADALREYLATPDMLNPRSPEMDAALLDLFYRGEQARRPAQVGDVLRRYAAEAATAGRADVDDMFAAPPAAHDVLRTALARQNKGDPMPEPPAPPARVAPEPIRPDEPPPPLPEAPEGAASPDLAAIADDTLELATEALKPVEVRFDTVADWSQEILRRIEGRIEARGSFMFQVGQGRFVRLDRGRPLADLVRVSPAGDIELRQGKKWNALGITEADALAGNLGLPARFEAVPPAARAEAESTFDALDRIAAERGIALTEDQRTAMIVAQRDGETPEQVFERMGPKADAAQPEAIPPRPAESPAVERSSLNVERTEAGDQILMPGIAPITDADRLAARAAQPLDGGTRASDSEIGGLFDPNATARTDLFDMPAARPGTAARDEVALDAADFVALRDSDPFRLEDDGAVGTLAEHLQSLERDATLTDLMSFCVGKPS